MELLLVPDLAMIGALVGLVALALVFLKATRSPLVGARVSAPPDGLSRMPGPRIGQDTAPPDSRDGESRLA